MEKNKTLLLAIFEKKMVFITNLIYKISNYLRFQVDSIVISKSKNVYQRGYQKLASDFIPILENIRKKEGYDYILGIIEDDLFVPELNFVFGIANEMKKTAIISLNRLHSDSYDLHFKRILTESIHEIGHLFGMKHCTDFKCVMFFSNSLLDTDRKSSYFCEKCNQEFYERFHYKLNKNQK